jgi:MFS transporter, DHA1 family, inner membrane transport protein
MSAGETPRRRGVDLSSRALAVVSLGVFLASSTWFSGTAAQPALAAAWRLSEAEGVWLTLSVQIGFIAGTFLYSILNIADVFNARRVFFVSALLGAALNAAFGWLSTGLASAVALRALTGVTLAGIYPVGMKIAAQWFPRGLGAALGLLVGALVLGSALPHALRGLADLAGAGSLPWTLVFHAVALASLAAAALLWAAVPPPPVAVKRAPGLNARALQCLVTDRRVRASVFGYFGHMGELYTVWVLAPLIVATRVQGTAVSWGAFALIGAGALGCVVGGWVARRTGSAPVAGAQLAASGACCLVAPWMLAAPDPLFWAWLLLWGITVAGDSPQFSTLTATNAPPDAVGSVLTLTNCIGFALSIVSIQLFTALAQTVPLGQLLPWLAIGPVAGLLALRPLLRRAPR